MKRTSALARAVWLLLGLPAAAAGFLAATAVTLAQAGFPFEQEMLLDARPLPGSRRIPILEIAAMGARKSICGAGAGRAWSRSRAVRNNSRLARCEITYPLR